MRYIVVLWAVVIIGGGALIIAVKAPSLPQIAWPQKQVTYPPPTDEGMLRTIAAVERILQNSPGRAYRVKNLVAADVIKVIDGDTIEVFIDGELMTVGYIGIDAPELERPVYGEEPFAVEALERNREIVEGKVVSLERDLTDVDERGRHLRYVYVGDLMVNALLLHEGLAKADASSRGLKYSEVIHLVEQQAMIERRGAWLRVWPNIARRQ